MSCAPFPAPDICPDTDQCLAQMLMLLPRGRAWETPPGTVRWRILRALAGVIAYANQRICDLRREFFCATTAEMRDVWMAEYGLPHPCDPFPDLCAKVAAQGGSRCDYFAFVAARAGWSIACVEGGCGGSEMGLGVMGCAVASEGDAPATLYILVDAARSPAVTPGGVNGFVMGAVEAGAPPDCNPDLSPLLCLMARIVPAHLRVLYRIV